MSLNTVTVENQGILYGVIYSDVPDAALKDIKTFFDSVERGLVGHQTPSAPRFGSAQAQAPPRQTRWGPGVGGIALS